MKLSQTGEDRGRHLAFEYFTSYDTKANLTFEVFYVGNRVVLMMTV